MKGVTFGSFHSYRDFDMKWLGPFEVSKPKPNFEYEEVPGRDGKIDYSEAITGHVTYKNREIETDFELETTSTAEYIQKTSKIANKLHGQSMNVSFDTDPGFYYHGRIEVSDKRKNERFTIVTVKMSLEPYKYKTAETVVTGRISNTGTVICNNLRKPVVPVMDCDSQMTVEFKGKRTTVQAGKHMLDFFLDEERNAIVLIGYGNVKFTYREGSL